MEKYTLTELYKIEADDTDGFVIKIDTELVDNKSFNNIAEKISVKTGATGLGDYQQGFLIMENTKKFPEWEQAIKNILDTYL